MANTNRVMTPWNEVQFRYLIETYNNPKTFSIKEIAHRMNKKFKTKRNTYSVGQQLVKCRKSPPKGIKCRTRPPGKGSESEEAGKVQTRIDKDRPGTPRATKNEVKARKSTAKAKYVRKAKGKNGKGTRRSVLARATKGKGRDPLLESDVRVLEVDLGDKGRVRIEISGALLLHDELIGDLSAAVTRCLTV